MEQAADKGSQAMEETGKSHGDYTSAEKSEKGGGGAFGNPNRLDVIHSLVCTLQLSVHFSYLFLLPLAYRPLLSTTALTCHPTYPKSKTI